MADALNSRKQSNRQTTQQSDRARTTSIDPPNSRPLKTAAAGHDTLSRQQLVSTLDDWDVLFESGVSEDNRRPANPAGDSSVNPADESCPQAADKFQVLDRCLAILAKADHAQGRFPKAEASYKQASAHVERLVGPGHPDMARCLTGLAELYTRQARYQEAGALLEQAHLLRRECLPLNHPDVALSLSALAENRVCLAKYGEALSTFQESIGILESVFGAAHFLVAKVKSSLAGLYVTLGRFTEAECVYREVLASRGEVQDWSRPVACEILTNLGEVACALGWYGEAEQLAGDALALTGSEPSAPAGLGCPRLELAPGDDGQHPVPAPTADCELALSADELRVLRLTAQGLGSDDISALLDVRSQTVSLALGAILRKLSVLPASVARQKLQSLIIK